MTHVSFWIIFFALCIALAVGALLAADLYLHWKHAPTFGVNVWGYRGQVLGRKIEGETRIIVLGGSTAFGYGVPTGRDFPALLERKLSGWNGRKISVANVGYHSQGAFSFLDDLQAYEYLGYDLALLYEGYNDVTPNALNQTSFRRVSPVFRLTGYLPILPVILRERIMRITSSGKSLEQVYRERAEAGRTNRSKVVFSAQAAQAQTEEALRRASEVISALHRQVGDLSADDTPASVPSDCSQTVERRWYCEFTAKAVEYALVTGRRVLVVGQPAISDLHVQQQKALRSVLAERFGKDNRVSYYDVGRQIDLKDRSLAFDGMHLTIAGNERLSEILVEPVQKALAK